MNNTAGAVGTAPAALSAERVPRELAALPNWLIWRYRLRGIGQKPTKVPYVAGTTRAASSTDPTTWRLLADAVAACPDPGAGGIGFVFDGVAEDGLCIGGVDLDHVTDRDKDEEDDVPMMRRKARADRYTPRFLAAGAYVERSPSGHGLHVIGRMVPRAGMNQDCVEAYTRGRFFTFTGDSEHPSPAVLGDISAIVADLIAETVAHGADAAGSPSAVYTGALSGTMAPAFLAPGLPDMNAAAAYQGASWFEQLPPARMDDLLMDAARFPAFAALADADYATWRDYLFAFHAAGRFGATSAAEAARAWSRSAAALYPGDAEFDRVWRSLKPGRIGVGTLLHKLQEVGFDLSPWRAEAEQQGQVASPPAIASALPTRPLSPFPAHWDTPRWVVPGFLQWGALTVLAAAGASGKTTLAAGLGMAMAAGCTVWGPYSITQPTGRLNVLYVAGEESGDRINFHAMAAAKSMGLSNAQIAAALPHFLTYDALDSGFRIGAPPPGSREAIAAEGADVGLQQLRATVIARRTNVVILDTASALLAINNENDNMLVAALLGRVSRLAKALGVAVLLTHHIPKKDRETAAGLRGDAALVRGGSAWTTTPRVVWTITAVPDAELAPFVGQLAHLDSIRRLDPAKINDGKLPAPAFFAPVTVAMKDGQGNAVEGRAIRWLALPPAPASNSALDSHKRAALAVAIAGAKDTQGATVPLSAAKTGASAGYKLMAAALQQHDPALSDRQAEGLAKRLIEGFLASGVLTAEPMAIPKYKPDGKPNGTVTRTVLKAHPEKAPWWMAANPMPAGTMAEQVTVPPAQTSDAVAEPELGRHAAAPATTTVVE